MRTTGVCAKLRADYVTLEPAARWLTAFILLHWRVADWLLLRQALVQLEQTNDGMQVVLAWRARTVAREAR